MHALVHTHLSSKVSRKLPGRQKNENLRRCVCRLSVPPENIRSITTNIAAMYATPQGCQEQTCLKEMPQNPATENGSLERFIGNDTSTTSNPARGLVEGDLYNYQRGRHVCVHRGCLCAGGDVHSSLLYSL